MKILSGIQPSGQLHIGNYFGMMKPMIQNIDRGELYAFIVNLHALTSVHDKENLSLETLRSDDLIKTAREMLASGSFRASDLAVLLLGAGLGVLLAFGTYWVGGVFSDLVSRRSAHGR